MFKKIFVLMIGLSLATSPLAGEEFAPVGTAVAQFLEIGVGARATGLGEAYTSLARGAEALFWNPAGIVDGKSTQLFAGYTQWPADIQIGGLGMLFGKPGMGTFALSASYLMTDDMEITTLSKPTGTGEFFNVSNMSLGLSYARYLTDKVSVGVTAKMVQENYYSDYGYTSWAFDMGTLYRSQFKNLVLGMSILHFGPEINFNGDYLDYSDNVDTVKSFQNYSLPMNFRVGLSMDLFRNAQHGLVVAADMVHPNNNLEQYNLGLEYSFQSLFALRGGYQLTADEAGLSAGFSAGAGPVMLDYSYVDMGRLPNVHRFGISLGM
jgi:hypothetical protein